MASSRPLSSVGLSRLFSVSSVIASAFAKNRLQEIAAFPWVLLTVLPFMLRGAVYQNEDRNGVVFFGLHRPGLDLGISLIVTLLFLPLVAVVPVVFLSVGVTVLVTGECSAIQLIALVISGVLFCGCIYGAGAFFRGTPADGITGGETPSGERYAIMGLSQRKGTTMSALLLTRALIRSLPKGKVLVFRAGSESAAVGYERLGLTRGRGLRVFLVTG